AGATVTGQLARSLSGRRGRLQGKRRDAVNRQITAARIGRVFTGRIVSPDFALIEQGHRRAARGENQSVVPNRAAGRFVATLDKQDDFRIVADNKRKQCTVCIAAGSGLAKTVQRRRQEPQNSFPAGGLFRKSRKSARDGFHLRQSSGTGGSRPRSVRNV